MHPDDAVAGIREGMRKAMAKFAIDKGKACMVKMPEVFDITVRYTTHQKAFRNALYPGAKQVDEKTIGFSTREYLDVLRFFEFVL
jgi:D-amino peptidase